MVPGLFVGLLGVAALVAVLVTLWGFARCLQLGGDKSSPDLEEKLIAAPT